MKTILILDDEQAIRESLVDYFEDCLWQTFSAESAEDALKLLISERVSAAVVDVRLSGMDGDDFIRQVLKRNTCMAFVICTGSPEYVAPPDLLGIPCLSERIFRKPITFLAELEEEILRIVKKLENTEVENER